MRQKKNVLQFFSRSAILADLEMNFHSLFLLRYEIFIEGKTFRQKSVTSNYPYLMDLNYLNLNFVSARCAYHENPIYQT